MWGELSTAMGSFFFFWAMFQKYFPYDVQSFIDRRLQKLFSFFNNYLDVTFPEFTGVWYSRNEAYTAIDTYLAATSTARAKRLRGHVAKPGRQIVLSMDDHEEVSDEFRGVNLLWTKIKIRPPNQTISWSSSSDEKRQYRLTFHGRYRDLVVGPYLDHVLDSGRAILARNRQRKLYTNNGEGGKNENRWSSVVFEHPASFQTLAMDPAKKKEIVDDLVTFKEAKEYYATIGKAWKRGYLLYGPPGTGKSTMIAAIANFLNYDIYDLELTAVKSNSELRNLLIDTSSKSIIVIEDIDCSLDLTGKRKKNETTARSETEKIGEKLKKALTKSENGNEEEEGETKTQSKESKVTLSGLLNFIDGIWSATGGERLIIFTTNHKDKLDEALIRRGRMDKHIELSYCDFESFKILANNYLSLESHPLFDSIEILLGEAEITPADVAENLMPKTPVNEAGDKESCLENLIQELKKAKEQQEKSKAEEKQKEKEVELKEKATEKKKKPKKAFGWRFWRKKDGG